MAVRKQTRRILRYSGGIILLALFVVAALPLWLPWILRPMAKRFGATYARSERHGYGRFQLQHLSFTNGAGRFEAEQVQSFVPTVWVWRRFFGPKSEPFLEVASWKYTVIKGGAERSVSVRDNFQSAKSLAATLRDWVPMATLTNGIILAPGWAVEIPQASWSEGKLLAEAKLPPDTKTWTLQASVEPRGLSLKMDSGVLDLHSLASLADQNEKLNVEGTIYWLTNRTDFKAAFSGDGFLPQTAQVRAESFSFPARLLQLKQYNDVAGSLRADWSTNRFTIELMARAFPQTTNLPSIDVEARASGDTNSAHIESAKIATPWLQAELPGQTDISFKPPFVAQPVTLNVMADLGQQPWFAARGNLRGEVTFIPNEKTFPKVSFSLSGTNVAVTNMTAKSLQLDGNLIWPQIELTKANVMTDDGSEIGASGIFNAETKTIHDGRLNFSGGFGRQFLPRGVSFESASLSVQFSGPLAAITNSVKLSVKYVQLPHAKPMGVEAAWEAIGLDVKGAQISLTAEASVLQARGSAKLDKPISVAMTVLELSQSNRIEMQLQRPFQIALSMPDTNVWALSLQPVIWSGKGRELQLEANVGWPRQGTFRGAAKELDSSLIRDFFEIADSEGSFETLAFSGGWTNGPVLFHLESKADVTTKERLPFRINADVSGGSGGIVINQLFISSATQIVSRAEGSLPIVIRPMATNGLVHINPNAPLELKFFTEPNSVIWEKIATASGLTLQKPNLKADLTGTWSAPQGHVAIQVDRIQWPSRSNRLPALENLDILAEMDRASARVLKCDAFIGGEPIRITAQIPLGQGYWSRLGRDTMLPDWRTASAKLEMKEAKLAAFARFLPEIFALQGNASAHISLEPGGILGGEVSVSGARTHPIDNLGPVRNIQARAVLAGQTVTLHEASAEIGGQRVNAEGKLELNEQVWSTNRLPIFQVHLHGTNVPLARNSSILLRSDFDLTVTNSISEPPLITGVIHLRDSLFLADLKSLAPGQAVSVERRPPYFSVNEEPWALWRLKVAVQGNNSFRVQTPLFRGNISTSLKLEGTLKDPIALGHVKIDSGSVTFPFGSLAVKQGFVSLTSEDPFHPQLFVTAAGQRFGYEIKMEATGPADQPVIQLSSVPPLPSDQIILMLTAGQAPRGIGLSTSTGQQAQGLALFVGKNLLYDFGLGVGGEDRLTYRSGEQISQSGRSTYELDYKLTERWSLIGQYDRFDQYNLNLKWKVYSK